MQRPRFQRLLSLLAGMLLAAGMGWLAFNARIGAPLARLSYDMMFRFRNADLPADEIRLVDIDEASSTELGQPRSGVWSRALHARLLRRLTADGAKAVFFDVIFDQPSEEPGEDEEFAAAIRENGRVFLGGRLDQATEQRESSVMLEQVKLPIPLLRKAARGRGTVALLLDPDKAARQIHPGTEQIAPATWEMARFLGASLPGSFEERAAPRWLNYYSPAGAMAHVSFHRALQADGVAPDFFKDKIVFIGARNRLAKLNGGNDEFAVPWTRGGGFFMPGAEVHANILLNYLHGTWLKRGDHATEAGFVVLVGLVVGGLLAGLRPMMAALCGLGFAVATLAGALWWFEHHLVWYNWLVPVAIQTPVAIAWSWASNYTLEARRRAEIRRAFALYLSPHMADRIADSQVNLSPGGELVEATVVFTDLEGFTRLSEELGDPAKLSQVLIEYFTNTTQHVLASQGTVIKYIGDAVFAAWGAPLADPAHAANAVTAAWNMALSSEIKVQGRHLVTRVGINTGQMLAGNLGSKFRFDYTLIGDAVNFASRLESLNKHFGTRVLLSESTHARLTGQFKTRLLGSFVVVGKSQPVPIHELLGPATDGPKESWLVLFAEGLAAFQRADFDQADALFRRIETEKGAPDGPAQFYLKTIPEFRTRTLAPDWTGAIELAGK